MKENLAKLWRMASFWVATLGAVIVLAWQTMPPELMSQLLGAFPQLGAVAPVLWLGAFIVARIIPQASVSGPAEKPEQ